MIILVYFIIYTNIITPYMYRYICIINLSKYSCGFGCLNCFTRKQTNYITRDPVKKNIVNCIAFDFLYWV